MSAARRHKKHHHEEHENHERWLVSGYDMMTLLFAVFVVLYAISSTNVSKVKALQQSLQEAFSGPVFSGGQAMQQTGDTQLGHGAGRGRAAAALALAGPGAAGLDGRGQGRQRRGAAGRPGGAGLPGAQAPDRQAREGGRPRAQGLHDRVPARPQGQAAHGRPLLRLGQRARSTRRRSRCSTGSAASSPQERRAPVQVEGHTDDRPIATSQFPSNWQLSGARAGAVVQRLGAAGVAAKRMSLGGYGAQHPVATQPAPSPGEGRTAGSRSS